MRYENIIKGVFISRPNRFIAYVSVGGEEVRCHVKNTGRCRELLVKGATVYLEESANPSRKTHYSLVAVEKGDLLINMDSQAPNKVVCEWLKKGEYIPAPQVIRPEYTYGGSRFDFYVEAEGERHLIEVKGVTLEDKGHVSFPDAPTERGARHMRELAEARDACYQCHVLFVVQMEQAEWFSPNRENDPKFADALKNALEKGVRMKVLTCKVTPGSLEIAGDVKIYKI